MEKVYHIGSRREVFWDDEIVDLKRTTAEKRLHHPVRKERVLTCDKLWEGNSCFLFHILQDEGLYRMYYFAGTYTYGLPGEVVPPESNHEYLRLCYAESRDGLHWEKPSLGICEYNGSTDNNIIINAMTDDWHDPQTSGASMYVLKDPNPACPPDERYKGIYGVWRNGVNSLKYVASADGIHFRPMGTLLSKPHYFDSLNTLHYDQETGKYICYFRGWHHSSDLPINQDLPPTRDYTRGICRMESSDFVHWTEPEPLTFADDLPDFHLYTNVIAPYYRAPHIMVGFPARYFDRCQWTDNYEQLCGKEERLARMTIQPRFGYSVTDSLFMSSRDGHCFTCTEEAFLRPEIESDWSWFYCETHLAAGLFETPSDLPGGFPELSMLMPLRRWTTDPGGTLLYRYALRPDGFISRSAGYEEKTLMTKPFIFTGDTFTFNFATSAGGHVKIEFLDKTGRPLEGYSSCELFGNTIDRVVNFSGDLRELNNYPVRLKFTLSDADVYSFRFIDR